MSVSVIEILIQEMKEKGVFGHDDNEKEKRQEKKEEEVVSSISRELGKEGQENQHKRKVKKSFITRIARCWIVIIWRDGTIVQGLRRYGATQILHVLQTVMFTVKSHYTFHDTQGLLDQRLEG